MNVVEAIQWIIIIIIGEVIMNDGIMTVDLLDDDTLRARLRMSEGLKEDECFENLRRENYIYMLHCALVTLVDMWKDVLICCITYINTHIMYVYDIYIYI